MARSAFKLKSDNISGGSSFKKMGATPGESPAKLYNLLMKGWQLGTKIFKGKTIVKNAKTVADDVANKYKKKSTRTKSNITSSENAVNTSNAANTKHIAPYGVNHGIADAVIPGLVVDGFKATKNYLDGSTVEVGPVETEDKRTGKYSDSTKTKTDTRETYE
jgi:hypothetical protein